MTIKTYSLALAMALAWMSCGNDAPQSSEPTPEATTTATPQDQAAPSLVTQEAAPEAVAPSVAGAPAPQPATTASAPTGGGSGKMNPPHGQPGHSCAVPVGAPLDGKAAGATGAAKTTTDAQPAVKTVTAPPPPIGATTKVAAGMNPPHGQPGHSCAVPVGSPLPK